jgi:hypothetical protein
VTYNAGPCPFIHPIVEHLQAARRTVSIEKAPYQFQRGGNMMMRISGGNGR